MKKILSIFLVAFIVVGLMAGCGGSDGSDSSNKDSADNTVSSTASQGNGDSDGALISTADVAFKTANGSSVYTVIRPDDSKMDEALRCSYVFKQIKEKIGVSVKQSSDTADGTDAYEILVGPTNRPESQQALDYLYTKTGGRYDDYIICTIGKKIVINAFNKEALDLACQYFVTNYLKAEGVKGGIEYTYAVSGDFKSITINGTDIGRFRIIRPHFNFSYLPQSETEKIVDYVYQSTGYMLEIAHDEYNKTEGEYEIVIGDAQRQNVPKITNYDEYTIKVDGKRVFLNGGSPHATGMAVSEFAKMVKAGAITDSSSVVNASYETALKGYDLSTTYHPTWYDTFDTEGVDLSKWRIMNDPEFSREGQNGKWSCMSNREDIVYQTGGKFYVQGFEDETTYCGGTIVNDKHMAFQYGYVEKSAICPDGPGFWSLLWFNGSGDGTNVLGSPEIDLNECFGEGKATQANCHAWPSTLGEQMGYEHTSLDGATYGNDKKVICPDGKTFADDFHTYGFLWDEDEMGFYLDGQEWFTYTTNTTEWDIDVFVNSWMFMELSFSVGRENNGLKCNDLTAEEWENSSRFIVDWLYLYQFDDGVQGLKLKQ